MVETLAPPDSAGLEISKQRSAQPNNRKGSIGSLDFNFKSIGSVADVAKAEDKKLEKIKNELKKPSAIKLPLEGCKTQRSAKAESRKLSYRNNRFSPKKAARGVKLFDRRDSTSD